MSASLRWIVLLGLTLSVACGVKRAPRPPIDPSPPSQACARR